MKFKLVSQFKPTGGQSQAIERLARNLKAGARHNILLGVTGAGKTFVMSNIIERIQKPVLLISHNKTLAAQTYQEFKGFFPSNSIHYFVSYYDYYQPEAYIPQTDTYIEKDVKINEEIDRLRHSAVQDLLTRDDVIVCASVSCIYNIGSLKDYQNVSLEIKSGQRIKRRDFLSHLTSLQYQRNDIDFKPGIFRVRGNIIEIFTVTGREIIRIEFNGDEIEEITRRETNGENFENLNLKSKILNLKLFPAHFWVTPKEKLKIAIENIKLELQERLKGLKKQKKLLEAQRLEQRTNYDLEMLRETGYCHGIENYSRHLEFRKPGEAPYALVNYFPSGFLIFIDESHMTLPQLHAMATQDRARKETLIEYGFRLPSAIDNRPLTFEEFEKRINLAHPSFSKKNLGGRVVYVSATPAGEERKKAGKKYIVEQLTRPTGLLEPSIEVRPTKNQVKDLIKEIKKRTPKKPSPVVEFRQPRPLNSSPKLSDSLLFNKLSQRLDKPDYEHRGRGHNREAGRNFTTGQRVLVLTLTKRLAEALSDYLAEEGISSQWLHAEVKTLERPQILKDLREGKYDVLIGINLLREGLDLPEVALVAILDADKEGFLRSETTLIQTMGRAARHMEGHVILYADKITKSMARAIKEVKRRRKIQMEYNKKHKIIPRPIIKPIRDWPFAIRKKEITSEFWMVRDEKLLEKEMKEAAKNLDFERAAEIRNLISELKSKN